MSEPDFPPSHDRALQRKVDRVIALLILLIRKDKAMAKTIDDLVNDIAAENGVITSMEAALSGLAGQVAALKSETTDADTAAKIDALTTQIEAKTAEMAAALTANTNVPTSANQVGAPTVDQSTSTQS